MNINPTKAGGVLDLRQYLSQIVHGTLYLQIKAFLLRMLANKTSPAGIEKL